MSTPVLRTRGNDSNEIPSLLVPMSGYKLILPTVSVAEMIPYQSPQQVELESAPEWYLGNLSWRGLSVPMLSYDILNDQAPVSVVAESQIIVLNNTGVSPKLPFICIPTQGIPRLTRIADNEISANAEGDLKPYDMMKVFVAGEDAIIPNVEKLEQACAEFLAY